MRTRARVASFSTGLDSLASSSSAQPRCPGGTAWMPVVAFRIRFFPCGLSFRTSQETAGLDPH